MQTGATLNFKLTAERDDDDYFAIPTGSRLDPRVEHREAMRRHHIMADYPMTLFVKDLYKSHEHRVVTVENLDTHLQCVRVSENKLQGARLSAERIIEMVREVLHDEAQLDLVDKDVLEALGIQHPAK